MFGIGLEDMAREAAYIQMQEVQFEMRRRKAQLDYEIARREHDDLVREELRAGSIEGECSVIDDRNCITDGRAENG